MTLRINSQEAMKHQMRRATQTQQGMTSRTTLMPDKKKHTHTHETKTILTRSTLKLGFWF